jgi:hypothetical protein
MGNSVGDGMKMKKRNLLCMIMTVIMMLGASLSIMAAAPVQSQKASICSIIYPTVTIVTPVDDSVTNYGKVLVNGTAMDDICVKNVTWSNAATGAWGWAYLNPLWGKNVQWRSRGSISLAVGENAITVTANDTSGNSASQIVYVTYDNVAPTCVITTPTSAATYMNNTGTIDLAGTASDANGIAAVVWKNKLTGASGTASGTTDWSIAGISLNTGVNLIYVNATDNAGNKKSDAIFVTYDLDSLSVSIWGAPSYTFSSKYCDHIRLNGTATDNIKVVSVTWSCDTGGSGTAYMLPQLGGTSVSWNARWNVQLTAGINVITVTAHDSSGNTATDTLTVTYVAL